MKINVYQFLFHPLHPMHSFSKKVGSVITNIALSILTAGVYLAAFGFVHYREKTGRLKQIEQRPLRLDSAKLSILKKKQQETLKKLETFAKRGEWQHLQEHTTHLASGFDWWMFPIDRPSRGYGDQYQVSAQDVLFLKQDQEFMKNYRAGVILVAKSWGWDVISGKILSIPGCRWTNYQVRLGKMLDSLRLFGQDDLHRNLVRCIDAAGIRASLEGWIQQLL